MSNHMASPSKQNEHTLNVRRPSIVRSQSGTFPSTFKNRKLKSQGGHTTPLTISGHHTINDLRTRKLGVFNAACSRMLNNLIGRNSMPPDILSTADNILSHSENISGLHHMSPPLSFATSFMTSPPQLQDFAPSDGGNATTSASTPNSPTGVTPTTDSFSFKKVFKKRSV